MKSARERMDMYAAYQEVGTYRAAAEICGTTDKTIKRAVEGARRAEAATADGRGVVQHNYDDVTDIIAQRVEKTEGRISAKRLLPVVRAAGYEGSSTEPPPGRRRGEGAVAHRAPPGSPPRGVGARRHVGVRLGRDRTAVRVLRRVGLEPVPLRLLRRQPGRRFDHGRAGPVHGDHRWGPQDPVDRSHGLSEGRHRGGPRHPDTGLRALRHPLRLPPRLLRGCRPGVEGSRREPWSVT